MVQKFKENEIVIFNSQNPKVTEVNGEKGYISGSAFDENKKTYLYAVTHIASSIVYAVYEYELTSTGDFYAEDD